jgi:type I restriction enzyme R subunit
MIFTAIKLRREKSLENPLLVFVTDRTDLVTQLNKVFNNCGFPNPIIARNMSDLRTKLQTGRGQTVFTTIHKFRLEGADEETGISKSEEQFPVLNADKNIFVLADEAHRSQYKYFALNMRTGLPNATYFAYTGTPLARNEDNPLVSVATGKTVGRFGRFIDVYDLRQSEADRATLPIFYDGRLPELRVEGESLDDIFDRIFADNTPEEREQLKQKYVKFGLVLRSSEEMRRK